MNVDSIYQLQRDDAFAEQFAASEYTTFLAMPFSNRGGYPEERLKGLFESCHIQANALLGGGGGRRFAKLKRVDEGTAGAIVITDEIIRQILRTHFFVADLTGCNFGVVLETGLALALKPNERVILFTQDETASLHFDLKVTNVPRYTEENLLEKTARALTDAARAFETEADRYIRLVSSQLTPDAISALNIYGRLWMDQPKGRPALWENSAAVYSPRFREAIGAVAFHNAVRELSGRRLLWTEYVPGAEPARDVYGMHATRFGWRVIEHLRRHDEHMRQPPTAPTGPNVG